MTTTYREFAIEERVATVEQAMSEVIDWWGDLAAPMKESDRAASRAPWVRLGEAIDSVEFVKRALDRQVPETDRRETSS
jgi:hypothetical protein